MRPLFLALLVVAASPRSAAEGALDDAARARSMLGGAVWSRIVRIENSRPAGILRRGSYPRTVYALVFELSGILWFYTDVDGTQSLSRTLGTVSRDEANPGPLFRFIDPGFSSWCWVEVQPRPRSPRFAKPRNACFIESIAALRVRLAGGEAAASPRLLSYYVDTPGGRLGHTVLLFETPRGLSAIDADGSGRPMALPPEVGRDAIAVSAYLRGGPVAAARTIPVSPVGPAQARWASAAPAPAPAG